MISIHCQYDELVEPKKLKDHPKNRNKHSDEQIERLAKLYTYHGVRHPIIVSKRSGCIVAGHGRKLAAIKAKIKAPVVYQDFESDEAEYAFIQADNAIALWSELDLGGINSDLGDLGPDFDLDMLGIQNFTLDAFENEVQEEGSEFDYTKKIEAPIYEIKGEKPLVSDLFDQSKTEQLLKEIDATENLPKDIHAFLKIAAQRHTIFNFDRIAEFYAHANPEVKELMENSALVIIDFEKAIEHGFVKLSQEIAESYKNDSN